MKVIGFNGSARKDGNTAIAIRYVLGEIEKQGIETELFQMAGKKIRGCTACMKCHENKDQRCSVKGDILNECIEKMLEADGIVIGSPTYFADLSTETKSLIERAGMTAKANDDMFKRKAGAGVAVARRGGCVHAFDSINHFFQISQMIIPCSCYWNLGFGLDKGDVEKDEEGVHIMKVLGQNMAWLLKKIHG
ncbi:flavodoxin family protein [Desulfococcaceae bacterium HSG8]|nr:flavodoxin family protein [Desulfococcaceae bacterium HSG8]